MTAARRVIASPDDWLSFAAFVRDMPMPYTVTAMPGGKRSLDQNALLHKWFGEVARQRGDVTMIDVKAQSNLKYGVPILVRDDPMMKWVYDQTLFKLSHEKQITLISNEGIACTSKMTKAQLTEYMDAFSREMRGQGYALTDPDT